MHTPSKAHAYILNPVNVHHHHYKEENALSTILQETMYPAFQIGIDKLDTYKVKNIPNMKIIA